ncbi:UbiA prenyltransferase family protein [Pontibacter sp. CAU 1760]
MHTFTGKVANWLLYSSAFISCCAFSLTVETYLLAGVPVSLPMAAFAFLATLFIYNLSSVQSMIRHPGQTRHRHSDAWSQRHKKLLAILGMASLAAAVALYVMEGLAINFWLLLHLALISVGYTVPVKFRNRRIKPLRSVPLLKVFLIAYVWAAVTALFPLLDAGMQLWEPTALWFFLRRFLFILALALLFDVRDYSYDRTTNTLTFPGLIGVGYTKLLSLGLLLLYALLLLQVEQGAVLWALLGSAVGAAVVVAMSSERKPRIYYAVLADGAMLLHAGLVYLAFKVV